MGGLSEAWIRKTDELLSNQGVAVKTRPWAAWGAWSTQSGPSRMDSPDATAIFNWYARHYPPRTFAIGPLFMGAFYFDQTIWPVTVPVVDGRFAIDVNGMLDTMPWLVRERMLTNASAIEKLVAVGVDCIDYGNGFDDLEKRPLATAFAQQLLLSADKELRSTVEMLLSRHPTQKAAESARMATEMFLKCYLAHYAGFDERGAMAIRHDLDKALGMCVAHDARSDLRALQGQFGAFPEVSERYDVRERSLGHLWTAYSLAQTTGTCLVRATSGRDGRGSIIVT